MKRLSAFVFLFLSALACVAADAESLLMNGRYLVSRPVLPDSADVIRLQHKSFWRGAAETFGCNMSLWAFDRYVQKGHFAYISWNTIKENFRHGFEWDNDHLSTNMFAHPYNGSIFYNAGRSNGYNFWQSELFAIGGSAMWELFMEREYPSTNDIIATPIGGAAIGEILYRTSDIMIDDRSTGTERFGRELAAFVIDPMRGFTRLVTGRSWQHRSTSGRRFGIPPVSVEISAGTRFIALYSDDTGSRFGASMKVNIEYGDRFAANNRVPYDYFSFLMDLNAMKTQPILSRIEIVGRLLSREIVDKANCMASVGMYQHFDYFDSDTIKQRDPERSLIWPCEVPYKLGTPASVGIGAMVRYIPDHRVTVDGYLHANVVALAGILTDFYRYYHRNYNWGSGFSFKVGIGVAALGGRLTVNMADQFYIVYTSNNYGDDIMMSPDGKPLNVQGDMSRATFNHFEAQMKYRLQPKLYVTFGIDFYKRMTHYQNRKVEYLHGYTYTPIIESKQFGVNLMISRAF